MILDCVKQAMQQQGGEESGSASGSVGGGSQKAGGAGGSQGSSSAGNLMNQIAMDGAEQMGETEEGKAKSWFEALAEALGKALDAQAQKVEDLGNAVSKMSETDSDKPSVMTELQAASQKMSFMMSAANDVLKTIGQALGEMARKH
jgi:flagellar hook-basal body complex protein FliE